jgi:hypothetical protein
MKKAIFIITVLGLLPFASCKKCATCTFKDEVAGTTLTDSICGRGKMYQNDLEQHDRNGWICTEQ